LQAHKKEEHPRKQQVYRRNVH